MAAYKLIKELKVLTTEQLWINDINDNSFNY